MAYGRVDVYWPDGPIESYQLEKSSVAIGRSPGNDIVIDTNAISRYHISLAYKDQQVVLEDLESVNGTYVDGTRIKAHEPLTLRGGEEIQLGDIRVIYQPLEDPDANATTRPMPMMPNAQELRRVEVQMPKFKVELDPPLQPVTPGAYIQATLTVTNTGNVIDHYEIEVDGIPYEWVRLDRPQVVLEPEVDAQILISFKPLRRSESAPGDYPVTVRVFADSSKDQPAEAPMLLRLRAYSGFGMVLGTPRITSAEAFELHVHNQGSGLLALAFSGEAPGNKLMFNIQPPTLGLGPGERKTIRGTVQSRQKPLLGTAFEQRFDLLARSQDASGFVAAVEGTLVEKPILPFWVPTLLIPLALALVIGSVLFGLAVFGRPNAPTIATFSGSSAKRFAGATRTLSWALQDSNDLVLRLDNGAPVKVDPKVAAYPQTLNSVGDHIFVLEAHYGTQVATQQLTVSVVGKALKINAFSVTPKPMLRNGRQNLNINWNVDGAISISFFGLEALTGKPDDVGHPPIGQLALQGTPRDTVELKMVASADDGSQVQQAVTVEIKDPICKIVDAGATMRSGPSENYPVVRSLSANSQVTPDGQHPSQLWIHLTPSPDPQAWVAASDLDCNGFATGMLTQIAAIPPVPTVPAAAAATQAPTPAASDGASPTPLSS